MQEISHELTALAAELGGRYDGWRTSAAAQRGAGERRGAGEPRGALTRDAADGRLRVAIVYGGQSAEHEISILSARNVLAALDPERFVPVPIGIDRAGQWLEQDPQQLLAIDGDARHVRLTDGVPHPLGPGGATDVDVIFPVLHGTLGEDGCVQGLFELSGIPYVGAGVLGSSIGMDKDVMKRLLHEAGIPVARFFTVRRTQFDADREATLAQLQTLGFPLFTKPANAGSSVGIRRVTGPATLEEAVRHAFEFDDKMLAEAAVTGREIELAVLGGNPPQVSVAGEIVVQHADGFYSYDAKYLDENGARLELPAQLPASQLQHAQQLAAQVFEVLECDGLARVDLFLTPQGELLVNEINTLPGFTAISMYPKLWGLSGLAPTQLVSRLIDLALERGRRRASLVRRAAPG
ncbi:MAG: D-alanine--D-alanine ligase [Proteobacteria bacterium]|nr:D-alanine--D-alanine ligase [Pseudomonadota bacterium]